MIVVTGAAGFIASCLVGALNNKGIKDIVIVDDFTKEQKLGNWETKEYAEKVDRNVFFKWFDDNASKVDFVFHLGARTDTTEFDWSVFEELNLNYTKEVWKRCTENKIPLIYASSAATYGGGEVGYTDNHKTIGLLRPLNPYGKSKNDFDVWALKQEKHPPFWAGTKFFIVYGSNEYHKGRMASVVLHTFESVSKTGKMQLFRSHRPDFRNGMQLRDFVYVKDVVDMLIFLSEACPKNGLYNIGTGNAESFLALATATFEAMGKPVDIEFIDMHYDIRTKYQYYTEATMTKLFSAGYEKPFYTLKEGIFDYVTNYLIPNKYF